MRGAVGDVVAQADSVFVKLVQCLTICKLIGGESVTDNRDVYQSMSRRLGPPLIIRPTGLSKVVTGTRFTTDQSHSCFGSG